MLPESLSTRLSRSVSADFFRPLARPSAPVYVDCADRLIEEAGEAGRLSQRETNEIIREVIARHPLSLLSEDEGAALRDARQRAGQFFNRLIAAGWLEDQTLGLHERWAVITPGLRPLLRMLRDLAEDRVAELKTFADTLRGLCQTLEERGVLDPVLQQPDQLRSTVTDLSQRLERAIEQLHAVEKIVTSFEQRQRQSATAADTLSLLYEEFGQGQHMVCYDALRRGGLLMRIEQARSYGYDSSESYDLAVSLLTRLDRDLGGLKRRAEAIDLRMAAFNRLSQQRYRYQTELRGRRPEIIKAYCDAINTAHAGGRFSELGARPADFAPRCVETRFFFGTESLYKPRRTKAHVDLTFGQSGAVKQSEDDVLAAWKERQRLALTPQRAARLVAKLLPTKKDSTSTEDIHLETTDDLLDLLAVVAYEHAPALAGKRVRWSVDGLRRRNGLEPHILEHDTHAGHRIERFAITREG
ncbi:Wadjet anti-phage system protein JetA family protein [Prosthecobacter sp.]|uniref:Wadjet anti-phage system protein JetA family protein n=1 Tax=Prosthecobacter sp. TaxID=1965333 RepID=UPI0037839DEF